MKAYFIRCKDDVMRVFNDSANKSIIECGDIKSCDGILCLECLFKDNTTSIELKQDDLIILEY